MSAQTVWDAAFFHSKVQWAQPLGECGEHGPVLFSKYLLPCCKHGEPQTCGAVCSPWFQMGCRSPVGSFGVDAPLACLAPWGGRAVPTALAWSKGGHLAGSLKASCGGCGWAGGFGPVLLQRNASSERDRQGWASRVLLLSRKAEAIPGALLVCM